MGGKGGSKAPSPDPNIGLAALKQAELGFEYLDFAKQSYADSMLRSGDMDALTKRVVEHQMSNADASLELSLAQFGLSKEQADLARRVAEHQMGISDRQIGLSEEQLGIAKSQQGLAERVSAKQMEMYDEQLAVSRQQQQWATEDRDRYKNVFLPIEDEFIKEATSYDSPERQAQAAAEAQADVQRRADMARGQTQRQMASMGIDPRSGRYQGIDRAAELETALASAGAQNTARNQIRDKGLALKADVANMGRGLPAQSAQAASIGLGASQAAAGSAGAAVGTMGAGVGAMGAGAGTLSAAASSLQGLTNAFGPSIGGMGAAAGTIGGANSMYGSAVGTMGAANANFFQSQNIMGAGFGQAMQGVANQANILNQQYQNQLSAWSAQQQANAASSSGLFGAIGTGLGLAFRSSKKVKENKQKVDGALDAVKEMPVEKWKYKDGVEDGGEHVGPYAEDFKEATGLGDGKKIAVQDAIGVTMKAVQELDDKVEKIATKMPGLDASNQNKRKNRRAA